MAVGTVHRFVIEPHKGVGPIRFGMHKDEVSHAFTYVYSSFFKAAENKIRADHCEDVGLIIHPPIVFSTHFWDNKKGRPEERP